MKQEKCLVALPTPGFTCQVPLLMERIRKIHNLRGEEYAIFEMEGTTFSGHPTYTTLGNTLWTICYAKYAMHLSGCVGEILAAGDDCVVYMDDDKVDLYIDSMAINVATDDKELDRHGLG